MKLVRSLVLGLTLIAPALLLASLTAPVITWNGPTTISGDSDVLNVGSVVWAYKLRDTTQAATIINGVSFAAGTFDGNGDVNSISIGSNLSIASSNSSLAGNDAAFSSVMAPYASLSVDYRSLLDAAIFNTGAGETMTVTLSNSVLTLGQSYLLQVWVSDPRDYVDFRFENIGDSNGNNATIYFNATEAEGGLGQFITGTFTANGVDPTLILYNLGSGGFHDTAQINAISLQAIPEPSTYAALTGLAALGLAVLRRRIAA